MMAEERYQMAQGVSRLGEEVASLWLDLAGLSHRVAQLQRLAMTLRQGLEAELAGRPGFDTAAAPDAEARARHAGQVRA